MSLSDIPVSPNVAGATASVFKKNPIARAVFRRFGSTAAPKAKAKAKAKRRPLQPAQIRRRLHLQHGQRRRWRRPRGGVAGGAAMSPAPLIAAGRYELPVSSAIFLSATGKYYKYVSKIEVKRGQPSSRISVVKRSRGACRGPAQRRGTPGRGAPPFTGSDRIRTCDSYRMKQPRGGFWAASGE